MTSQNRFFVFPHRGVQISLGGGANASAAAAGLTAAAAVGGADSCRDVASLRGGGGVLLHDFTSFWCLCVRFFSSTLFFFLSPDIKYAHRTNVGKIGDAADAQKA